MNKMVERVARALAEQWELPEWDAIGSDHREKFRADARAAIEAMREPTETMIMAPDGNTGCAEEVWQFMIDAALKE